MYVCIRVCMCILCSMNDYMAVNAVAIYCFMSFWWFALKKILLIVEKLNILPFAINYWNE